MKTTKRKRQKRSHNPKAVPKTQRQSIAREKSLSALGLMRSLKISLGEAAKIERVDPRTVVRYVDSALERKGKRGKYRAKPHDNLVRPLNLLTDEGTIPVLVRGTRTASLLGEHLNAVKKYRNTRDASDLQKFAGKAVRTSDGKRYKFLTDTELLNRMFHADVFRAEGLYRVTHAQ